MSRHPGIEARHRNGCPRGTDAKARCRCEPAYRVTVWSPLERKRLRRTFDNLDAARAWHADAGRALRRGELTTQRMTLNRVWADFEEAAREGIVRSRSGARLKPSTLRSYEEAARLRILPALGELAIADVSRPRAQHVVDRLLADGLDGQTVKNTVNVARSLWPFAIRRGLVADSPWSGLEVPAAAGRRERVATPEEFAALLAALPDDLQPLYALAFHAGLRRGELLALRVSDVDLEAGTIRVERSWDATAGEYVPPKSRAGKRSVPITAELRAILAAHILRTGRRDGLLLGDGTRPLDPRSIARRSATAWKAANAKRREEGLDPLKPIGLHECRHSFASCAVAAGVSPIVVARILGHADGGALVFARYGHALKGAEAEAADTLSRFLAARSATG